MKRWLLQLVLASLAGPAFAVGQADRTDLEANLADRGQQVIQKRDSATTRDSQLDCITAEKLDRIVNWAITIDQDRTSPTDGVPLADRNHAPETFGEEAVKQGICPSTQCGRSQQPASYSPQTRLFSVPTNRLCVDHETFPVSFTPGQPFVAATLGLYPPTGSERTGNVIAWDGVTGRLAGSIPESFSVWSGAWATAADVVFSGSLEAVDGRNGRELYRFKAPPGIVGNPMTVMHDGRQSIAALSGGGGWAGIGLTDPSDGSGAGGGYAAHAHYRGPGGQITKFALP